jgi:hypothetical protein
MESQDATGTAAQTTAGVKRPMPFLLAGAALPREFIFDRAFLVYLQKRGAAQPFSSCGWITPSCLPASRSRTPADGRVAFAALQVPAEDTGDGRMPGFCFSADSPRTLG